MQPSVSGILKCSPQDHRAVGDLCTDPMSVEQEYSYFCTARSNSYQMWWKNYVHSGESWNVSVLTPILSHKFREGIHACTHTHTEFWVTLSRRVYWWKWGPFWMKLNLGLSLFSGRKRLLLGRDRCGRDENWKKIKRDAFLGQVSSVVKSTVLAQPCLYNFWQNTEFGSQARH